ncbi:Peroxidase [Heracleum sosnowskyi]|uniref:Peroxidase n=1 Tax=Heracleum sosnowskyi TaxID=360622 RepID=A0AAD8GTT4_9APIA|nr:Peroxidase [Heracleum sosnowskyi]
MRLKLVTSQWSHNVLPQCFTSQNPSSSIASTVSSTNSSFFSSRIRIPQKFPCFHKPVTRGEAIKRSCSASLDDVSDEFSSEYIKELAQSFELSCDGVIDEERSKTIPICTLPEPNVLKNEHSTIKYSESGTFSLFKFDYLEPRMLGIRPEPPEWPEREEVLRASIERKVNSTEIPFSLRMIKKKQQRREGVGYTGDLESCSFQKAFSSMEFIIIELQSCALQLREVLCDEDLEGIIAKVQRDMHASFLWLFQQVFSRTPDLMINVMVLLSNFSLYSTAHNIGSEVPVLMEPLYESMTEEVSMKQYNFLGIDDNRQLGRSAPSFDYPGDVPDHDFSQELDSIEELKLWKSVVDEAKEMQVAGLEDIVPDHEELRWFVSPVTVEIEPDNNMDYFKTDLLYQMGLSQDPDNSLLLCNYAQFLHLVAHDYDRAEECFKRAVQVEPPDAESMSHYANFLWKVRKDLWGAEEKYIQAMAAEADNSYHASRYANFLWNTGGDETCFPLDTSQNNSQAL